MNNYAKKLKENGFVEITEDIYLIYVQEHSEGGFDGSVYLKEDYIKDEDTDCIDGGIFEDDDEIEAIQFFIEIMNDLKTQ
jgi:hypothetical protein